MEAKTFFQNFEHLAQAPDGIGKLRRLILRLAVQGQIVEQDSSDGSSFELFEDIKDIKEKLIKEKKIRPPKLLPELSKSNCLWSLPETWAWVYLSDIGQIVGGGTPKTSQADYYSAKGIPWLTPADLSGVTAKYVSRGRRDISEIGLQKSSAQLMPKGAVLFSSRAPIGYVAIAANPLSTNQGFKSCIPFTNAMSEYIHCFLKSVGKEINDGASGTTFREVSGAEVARIPFALPPLAEQKRIVAKVDELMGLCDEMEGQQEKRWTVHAALVRSAHDQLLTAPKPQAFKINWNRIANNFDHLYTTPDSIKQLRQTILQLAVQGKLVPQDSKNEAAMITLERVKSKASGAVKRKKNTSATPIDAASAPFDLPLGWTWARFPEIGEFARGKSKHRPRNDPALYRDGTIPLVQTGDVARANGTVKTYTGLYNETGLSQSRLWKTGTMCITIAANIADSAILGFDACFPDSIVGFVPSEIIGNVRYFEFFTRTAKNNLIDYAPSTAQKNINLGILNEVLVPLPPVNEIKRIVAKVDHLMSLCDDLESKLTRSEADADKLMEAMVHHLTVT